MNYNWNWHIFFEPNPMGTGTYLDMLLSGLALTLKTAVLAWIIALIFGSLPRGQKMAATALGLTTVQGYRYVLLPMAFRIILPPLTSEFLNIIKNSAVALTIGLIELTAAARSMQEFSFQVFEAFTGATILYIIINIIVVNGMRVLERRLAVPGYVSLGQPIAAH